MKETIYIVTYLEGGWDNVEGAFRNKIDAIELCAHYDKVPVEEYNECESMYIIHEKELK